MEATRHIEPGHLELGHRLRDLARVLKMLRQEQSDVRPAIPAGLAGMLMLVQESGDRHRQAGCQPKELARRSGLDPSTVSRAAAALVARGLVERRPDPRDGRAAILVLTGAGRQALDETDAWYEDVLRRALEGWTPEDVDALATGLGRFVIDLERTVGTIHPHPTLEPAP